METYILATAKDFLQKRYSINLQSFSSESYWEQTLIHILPTGLGEVSVKWRFRRLSRLMVSVNLVKGGKMSCNQGVKDKGLCLIIAEVA